MLKLLIGPRRAVDVLPGWLTARRRPCPVLSDEGPERGLVELSNVLEAELAARRGAGDARTTTRAGAGKVMRAEDSRSAREMSKQMRAPLASAERRCAAGVGAHDVASGFFFTASRARRMMAADRRRRAAFSI
jgi:hypothetical protein